MERLLFSVLGIVAGGEILFLVLHNAQAPIWLAVPVALIVNAVCNWIIRAPN